MHTHNSSSSTLFTHKTHIITIKIHLHSTIWKSYEHVNFYTKHHITFFNVSVKTCKMKRYNFDNINLQTLYRDISNADLIK